MTAYYNEIDPFAAQWLRELIKENLIAPGEVDERSIEDVKPNELTGFTQCHFFAGIGVWSYALRKAGWPDDRPVWTGSCPCQPFSASGKRKGFDDERHLWPAWQWLISKQKPPVIFGEQVASKSTGPWFDLVQADVEAMGYSFGCVPFPSASVGAPHMRDRAFWLANADSNRLQSWGERPATLGYGNSTYSSSSAFGLADSSGQRLQERIGVEGVQRKTIFQSSRKATERDGNISGLANTKPEQHSSGQPRIRYEDDPSGRQQGSAEVAGLCGDSRSGSANGFWGNFDWLFCRDGKFRPVEPGASPLANGSPARVGRLRGYGNAINAKQAEIFIRSSMEII